MNKKIIPLILAGTSFLVACNNENATNSPTISKEDAVAVVNGQYISKASLATLEAEVTQRARGQSFPKEKLIDELVQRELLIQDAIQKQLDKSAEFSERLNAIKKSLLSQEAIQNHLKSNPVTDADLEAEYNKTIAESGTEYKARHILLETEEAAKQLIAELDKGANFVELAKAKSTGPSAPQGGDLGWFSANQMVEPFSKAAIALEDGKYTVEPVKTQYGWHVILREGSRAQTPPPFESVKEQIRPMMQRKKMQDFLDSLRNKAKIEILSPKAEEEVKAIAPVVPAEATEKVAEPDSAKVVEETAKEAVTEVKVEASEKATEAVTDAKEQALEAVKSAVQEASSAVEKSVDESATKVSDSASKALEAVTK